MRNIMNINENWTFIKDISVIRKVEKMNPDYILREQGAQTGGADKDKKKNKAEKEEKSGTEQWPAGYDR